MTKIEKKVENIIINKVKEIGYDIYDVRYEKEGKDYYLRIFIEKENEEITLEDCEKVSVTINPILDKEDLIKEQYFLEVSSTGIEKTLREDKHFENAINKEILIKLYKKDINNKKEIKGILKEYNKNDLVLQNDNDLIKIEKNNIAQAKTIYNWE